MLAADTPACRAPPPDHRYPLSSRCPAQPSRRAAVRQVRI
uniref:Uncharacterized protein n=1 Tax=Arundo donax TaxID=35708 RepID=A0A0A9G7F8_ARUDO